MDTPGQSIAVLVALAALLVGYGVANSPRYSQPHMLVWCFFAIFMRISSWLLWECCLYLGVYSPLRDIPKAPVGPLSEYARGDTDCHSRAIPWFLASGTSGFVNLWVSRSAT